MEGKKRRKVRSLVGGDIDSGIYYLRKIFASFHFIFLKGKRIPILQVCFKIEKKGRRKTLEMVRSFASLDKTLPLFTIQCVSKK